MDISIRTTFIMVCILSASLSTAQSAHELFVQGNNAYEQRQWNTALHAYKAIDNKGCAVWYNMGNCFYKIGNISQAIICWKRAMLGASAQEQMNIAKNLSIAYEKQGYKHDVHPYTFFEQWAYRMPLLYLQLLFLFCWYALWIFLLFGRRRRALLFYGVIVSLLFATLLIGNVLRTHYVLYTYKRGQVIMEKAYLFSGPHDQYHEVGSVALFDEVQINEKREGWYKVAKDNQHGWIPATAVELI